MQSKLLPAVLCCLAGTCAAEPVRLSDGALDRVTAGTLSWSQLPSAVQQAFQVPVADLPAGAAVVRLPEDTRFVIAIGQQQFEVDPRSVPFVGLAGRVSTLAGDGRTVELVPFANLPSGITGSIGSPGAPGAPGANGSTVNVSGAASASTTTIVRTQ